MIYRVGCLILLGLMLTGVSFAQSGTETEPAAVSVALKWLAEVDEGKYGDSWNDTAGYFKNAVTKAQWVQSLQSVRKPLGKLISRAIKDATHTTSLPGAPDGEYVVIQFQTSFENKKSAIETITPMMDPDGVWRVSGYFIK